MKHFHPLATTHPLNSPRLKFIQLEFRTRAAEFISRLRNRDIFSPVAGTARRVSSRQSLVPIVISQKTDNYERVLATTINTRQPFTCINQR